MSVQLIARIADARSFRLRQPNPPWSHEKTPTATGGRIAYFGAVSPLGCYRHFLVREMNRRNIVLAMGIGALAAAIPGPQVRADPPRSAPLLTAPPPGAQAG